MSSRMRLAAAVDDSPQIRIALALLVAFIVWIVFLLEFGRWLGASPSARVPDKPLEMRVVELDPPQTPVAAPAAVPATSAKSATIAPARPRQPADPRVHASAQPRTTPPAQSVQSVAAVQSASEMEKPNVAAEPPAHTPGPSSEEKPGTTTSSSDTGAHALAQPLPEIPDDLRDATYQTVATARFMIHADGSVDVELIKPTPNPRLNQILLEALRKWRFFPAMQAGHPVESRQDIRVHFNVN